LTKSRWLFCFSEASLLAGANKQKRQLMRSIRKRLRAAQHSRIGAANPVLGTIKKSEALIALAFKTFFSFRGRYRGRSLHL